MRGKRIILVSLALWLALSGSAFAAQGAFSGEVDSGGQLKYFSTQRVPTMQVRIRMSEITANGRIAVRLYNCNNLTFQGGEVVHRSDNTWRNQPYAGNGICFRASGRRTVAADTNGWLPGNGTTSFTGQIQW